MNTCLEEIARQGAGAWAFDIPFSAVVADVVITPASSINGRLGLLGDSDLDSDSWDNTMSLRFLVDTGVLAAGAGASSDAATDVGAFAATDVGAFAATDAIACLEFPFVFF